MIDIFFHLNKKQLNGYLVEGCHVESTLNPTSIQKKRKIQILFAAPKVRKWTYIYILGRIGYSIVLISALLVKIFNWNWNSDNVPLQISLSLIQIGINSLFWLFWSRCYTIFHTISHSHSVRILRYTMVHSSCGAQHGVDCTVT